MIQMDPKWSQMITSKYISHLCATGGISIDSFLFSTYFNIFQHIPSIGLNWKMQYTALVVGSAIIVGRSVTAFELALLQRLERSRGKVDARDSGRRDQDQCQLSPESLRSLAGVCGVLGALPTVPAIYWIFKRVKKSRK